MTWIGANTEEEQVKVNLGMLKQVVDTALESAPLLQHIYLQTGTKYYSLVALISSSILLSIHYHKSNPFYVLLNVWTFRYAFGATEGYDHTLQGRPPKNRAQLLLCPGGLRC